MPLVPVADDKSHSYVLIGIEHIHFPAVQIFEDTQLQVSHPVQHLFQIKKVCLAYTEQTDYCLILQFLDN